MSGSKQVTTRQKSANSVAATVATHGEELSREVEAMLRPHLEANETMPDVNLLMSLFGRHLVSLAGEMVEADRTNLDERREDAEARGTKDDAVAEVKDEIGEWRDIITGVYGRKAAERARLTGTLSDDPVTLARHAADAVVAIRKHEFGRARRRGPSVDREEVARLIEEKLETLEAAIVDINRETRETTASQTAKNEAITTFDARFIPIAGTSERLFQLIGRQDLAADVRPSTRRPGRTEKVAEGGEPEVDGGEAPVDGEVEGGVIVDPVG